MKRVKKQLIIVSIILSITMSFFQQNYVFAKENGDETRIAVTYQGESNSKAESICLLTAIKANGNKLTINCNNVCPNVVTNINIQLVIASWDNTHTKIFSYTARPISVGSLAPGSGTKVTYTIPAVLPYPIQAETYITGNVIGQITAGYGVVVFN